MPDKQTDVSTSKRHNLEIALACTPDLAAQILTHWRSMGARPIGTAADLLGVDPERGPARQAILDRISLVHGWSMSPNGESFDEFAARREREGQASEEVRLRERQGQEARKAKRAMGERELRRAEEAKRAERRGRYEAGELLSSSAVASTLGRSISEVRHYSGVAPLYIRELQGSQEEWTVAYFGTEQVEIIRAHLVARDEKVANFRAQRKTADAAVSIGVRPARFRALAKKLGLCAARVETYTTGRSSARRDVTQYWWDPDQVRRVEAAVISTPVQ